MFFFCQTLIFKTVSWVKLFFLSCHKDISWMKLEKSSLLQLLPHFSLSTMHEVIGEASFTSEVELCQTNEGKMSVGSYFSCSTFSSQEELGHITLAVPHCLSYRRTLPRLSATVKQNRNSHVQWTNRALRLVLAEVSCHFFTVSWTLMWWKLV